MLSTITLGEKLYIERKLKGCEVLWKILKREMKDLAIARTQQQTLLHNKKVTAMGCIYTLTVQQGLVVQTK